MDKEYLISKESSVTLNITAGKIDSYRKKEETTSTVRVYKDGKIGIAGALGLVDEKTLTAQAEKALANGIPYVSALDGELNIEVHNEKDIISTKDFVPEMQNFLDRVGEACPRFAISNKIYLNESCYEYNNSNGRRLACSDNKLGVELLFQARGSGNLMDCFYGWEGKKFDPDKSVEDCKAFHDAYFNEVDIEPGEWTIVSSPFDVFGTFLRNFIGEMYVSGSSLVSGKLGEKVFADNLTISCDMNPATHLCTQFFDDEGQVADDFRPTIIENGVLKGVLTTKNTAKLFGLPVSKTSAAAYDGVPQNGFRGLYVRPTHDTLAELAKGKAIYLCFASGGDTTPDGHFATPVQTAFLIEDGKLVGRIPEVNISGDFFDMLGKNYIGTVQGNPYQSETDQLMAVRMTLTK